MSKPTGKSLEYDFSNLYEKLPLGDNCIRLLHLSPRSLEKSKVINGNLEVVDLSSHPTYHALSYCWGEQPEDIEILPEIRIRTKIGSTVSTSSTVLKLWPNCNAAIRALISNALTGTIWIDAVCINQGKEGDEEKKSQLPLMPNIYGGAEKVWIWLGAEHVESFGHGGVGEQIGACAAIDWIQEEARLEFPLLVKKFKPFPDNMQPLEVVKLIRFLPSLMKIYLYKWNVLHKAKDSPAATQEAIAQSMVELLNRDWFTRMWTIQELVMASEPIALCGNRTISWNTLRWGIISAEKLVSSGTASNDYATRITNSAYNDTFNSVITASSFWIEFYRQGFMRPSPFYNWVSKDSFLYPPWEHCLDLLYKFKAQLWRAQQTIMLGIMASRLYRGLRPLDSVPLAVVVWFTTLTFFITPNEPRTEQSWQTALRGNFPSLLHMLRTRSVSFEADRVFALTGVYERLGIPSLKIDYKMPIGHIYWDFAQRVIMWMGNLRLLMEVGGSKRPEMNAIPSWVPDWGERFEKIVGKGDWSAAAQSKPDFHFAGGEYGRDGLCYGKLVAKGLVIDRVSEVDIHAAGLRYDEDDDDGKLEIDARNFIRDNPTEIFRTWSALARNSCSFEPSTTAPSEPTTLPTNFTVRLFTAIHSATDSTRDDKGALPAAYLALLPIFRQWMHLITDTDAGTNTNTNADYNHTHNHNPTTSPKTRHLSLSSSPLQIYHDEQLATLSRSRLFLTANRRLGNGPPGLRKGDIVALLAGLRVPMLLREVRSAEGLDEGGPRFRVFGAVFVDGVMEGQAWRESEREREGLEDGKEEGMGSLVLV